MRLIRHSRFGLVFGGSLALAGGLTEAACSGNDFNGCAASHTCTSSSAGSSGDLSAGHGGESADGKAGQGGSGGLAGGAIGGKSAKGGTGGRGDAGSAGDDAGAGSADEPRGSGGTHHGPASEAGAGGSEPPKPAGDGGRDAGADDDAGMGGAALQDTVAPKILKVTTSGSDAAWPADGGKALTADANIVVVFDEPMDRKKTEAAYVSLDLPKSSVRFLWSEDDSWLVIQPLEPLPYREVSDLAVDPNRYTFEIDASATDVAGNPLGASQTFTFTTLRHVKQTIALGSAMTLTRASDDSVTTSTACAGAESLIAGDTKDNGAIMAFANFNIFGISSNIVAWNEATLTDDLTVTTNDNPYSHLGDLHVYTTTDLLPDLNWDSPLTDAGRFAYYYGQPDTAVDVLSTLQSDIGVRRIVSFAFRFDTLTDGNDREAHADMSCYYLRLNLDYLAP